jgi:uncharacterized protein (DUF1501 family)
MIDRRVFLKSGGLALVAGGFLPNVFVRLAQAAGTQGRRTLLVVFQRGAVDGLNVVVPYGEKAYYDARPNIAIAAPGTGEDSALDLDGFFAFHPALAPLLPLWWDRSLAVVHACGSPDPTRSHFDAQDFMESGTPGVKSTRDGFLCRALAATPPEHPSPLRGVAVTPGMPRALSGGAGAIAMSSIRDFRLRAGGEGFESLYSGAGPLAATAKESFEALKILRASGAETLQPGNGAQYPRGRYGDALKEVARLVKASVGLEVAFVESNGWDHHVAEGAARGQLANRLRDWASGLSAFARDLGSRMADVTVVTVSEFGRTVRENGNRGTDHGHGNVAFLLGGGVKGGKVHGKWPGLTTNDLYEGRDLAVTTDFRDLFAEVLLKRLGVRDLAPVFPDYALAEDGPALIA